MKLGLLIVLLCFFSLRGLAANTEKIKIELCNDEAGWPPFAFEDSTTKRSYDGLSADILERVFQRTKYVPHISLMPWSRCLGEAQKGEVDIVLDLYFSAERALFLSYSEPYYQLSSSLYFLKKNADKVSKIQSLAGMKKFKACGRREFDYSHFNLKSEDFVALANSYEQLYSLLERERCEYFPEESEIVDGLRFAKNDRMPMAMLGHKKAQWIQGPKIHWAVSRKSKHHDALLKLINSKFAEIKRDPGFLDNLKKKYFLK